MDFNFLIAVADLKAKGVPILIGVLFFGLIIAIHEFGHFIFAKLFGVKVDKVNTMNVRGHFRRYGRFEGYKPSWKKAIVTLTEDSKTIEFFDGMF